MQDKLSVKEYEAPFKGQVEIVRTPIHGHKKRVKCNSDLNEEKSLGRLETLGVTLLNSRSTRNINSIICG